MHRISGPALCLTFAAALAACVGADAPAGDDVGGDDVGDDQPGPDAAPVPEVDAGPTECPDGYQDIDGTCAPTCAALDCGGHGACVEGDGGADPTCACDDGYQGAACDACAPGYRPDPDDDAACTLALPSTTGLALWLDTTVLSSFQVSVNAIASWEDRRGTGATLTAPIASARPTYVGAALNGRAVVRFADGDDLEVSGFTGLRGDDYTIFVVMKPGPLGADTILRTANGEQGTTLRLERLSPGVSYRLLHDAPFNGAGDVVSASFGNTSSTKLLVARRWTSGLLDHQRLIGNDGAALDGIDVVQPTLVETEIGISHTLHLGDGDLQGDIAEVLVYDRAIDTAELGEIQAYLAAKWGVE